MYPIPRERLLLVDISAASTGYFWYSIISYNALTAISHKSSKSSNYLITPTLIAIKIHNAISPSLSSMCCKGFVGKVIS